MYKVYGVQQLTKILHAYSVYKLQQRTTTTRLCMVSVPRPVYNNLTKLVDFTQFKHAVQTCKDYEVHELRQQAFQHYELYKTSKADL